MATNHRYVNCLRSSTGVHFLCSHDICLVQSTFVQQTVCFRALDKILKKRSIVISRSTFPSTGHYGGHWSGDVYSTWEDLHYSIPGTHRRRANFFPFSINTFFMFLVYSFSWNSMLFVYDAKNQTDSNGFAMTIMISCITMHAMSSLL